MFKYFFACPEGDIVSNGKLLLERLGAAAVALRDCNLVTSQCLISKVGPENDLGAGVILDPLPVDGSLHRAPGPAADYKWLAIDSGREGVHAMIGFDPKAKLSPMSLCRRKFISGPPVTNDADEPEDAQEWIVPRARNGKDMHGNPIAFGNLDTFWTPAPKGAWARVLDRKQQWIYDFASEVREFLAWYVRSDELGPRPQWDYPWHVEAAVRVIGMNYRLGMAELTALEELQANPFNNQFVVRVLHGFTGFEVWDAWVAVWRGQVPKTAGAADSAAGQASQSANEKSAVDAELAAAGA